MRFMTIENHVFNANDFKSIEATDSKVVLVVGDRNIVVAEALPNKLVAEHIVDCIGFDIYTNCNASGDVYISAENIEGYVKDAKEKYMELLTLEHDNVDFNGIQFSYGKFKSIECERVIDGVLCNSYRVYVRLSDGDLTLVDNITTSNLAEHIKLKISEDIILGRRNFDKFYIQQLYSCGGSL